ncbi:hypothetical protein IE077_002500 [Cardiosporidium cionae]|uniref:Uncharacterized protein n=1 Tax=Cardiosporidium cionae TaxID=476202 RepID=A0ABQ7JAP5_9APIC|nr:hypothetical protein IE077_002500 [Cardiosporidium cionae]|eukprot:KAF8821061.1 hypothetical protein IE077_002500 [Cardiosporidium cionae]
MNRLHFTSLGFLFGKHRSTLNFPISILLPQNQRQVSAAMCYSNLPKPRTTLSINKWKKHTKANPELKELENDTEPDTGYSPTKPRLDIPYKFHFQLPEEMSSQMSRNASNKMEYTDFSGNRFPTLSTAENYRYWQDRGFDRITPRIFPFKIPSHRKLDPTFREFLFFLHSLDPSRFTDSKIGERYGLRPATVKSARQRYSVEKFQNEAELGLNSDRRITKEEATMLMKEKLYASKIEPIEMILLCTGYDHAGEEGSARELTGFQGYKSTFDWLHRQAIHVERMSAFPLKEKRDPSPKRVDVDVTVLSDSKRKIMNWIDPKERVVF